MPANFGAIGQGGTGALLSQQRGYGSGSQPWYDFSVSSDAKLSNGGSSYNNTDVGTPIDTVLTAPTSGTITYLGYPLWGGQITYKEDNPTDPNNPYVFLIHLDALNPNLVVGQHIAAGTMIGYSGGQYPGQFAPSSYPSLPAGYTHHDTAASHSTGPHLDIGVTNSPSGSIDNNQSASNLLVTLAKNAGIGPISPQINSGGSSLTTAVNGGRGPCPVNIFSQVPILNSVYCAGYSFGGSIGAPDLSKSSCQPWDINCLAQQAAPYALKVGLIIAGATLILVGLHILFPNFSPGGISDAAVDKLSGALEKSGPIGGGEAPAAPPAPKTNAPLQSKPA